MFFTSQSMTSKLRCTYGHPLIFAVLAYSMQYPYTQFFNLVHWMQMSQDGGMVTVHHICQFSSTLTWSLWINVFKWSSSKPKDLPEYRVSVMSKWSSFKRENHFLAVLSPIACPHTRRKCFWPLPLLLPLCWSQGEEYIGNVSISPLGTSFLASAAALTIFKWQNFNM